MAICQTQTEKELPVWGSLIPSSSSMEYPEFELISHETTFGRDAIQCDYELQEQEISQVHATIVRNLEKHKRSHCGKVIDKSKNGTFVNKKKIGKNKDMLLFDGDEIQFLNYEWKTVSFLFYCRVQQLSSIKENSMFCKYKIQSYLGTGRFSRVKSGINRETGEQYAIKEIRKKCNESKRKSCIMKEFAILAQIDHPQIIKVFDVYDEYHTLYIVLEMSFGDKLFKRIIEKRLTEPIARHIMKQLLSAIMYLHGKKIAHHNLRPENILMINHESWDIKITDFGLARLLDCDGTHGTPLFLAPEMLNHKKGGCGFKVDYWCIGIILYLMLCNHPPFQSYQKSAKILFPQKTWKEVSDDAKDLVLNLMQVDVVKRYNGEKVLQHSWMNTEENRANRRKINPKKRKNDDECKINEREPPRKKYKINQSCK